MQASLESLTQRFNALNGREKTMSTAAVVLVVWSAWDTLFYQNLQNQAGKLASEISVLESDLATQRLVADQLKQMDLSNPAQKHVKQLQDAVDRLKLQLDAGEKKFVPPQLMAAALRDMLQQHGNLKLVKLETLPSKPFGNDDNQPIWIYRHTLELTVQGDFFSTLDYLKALETLPWRVHWNSIDYRVDQYPIAQTRIQVYTLSFDKDWLGA